MFCCLYSSVSRMGKSFCAWSPIPGGKGNRKNKESSITNKAKESCAFQVTALEHWLWPLGLGVKAPHFAPDLMTAPREELLWLTGLGPSSLLHCPLEHERS